MPTAMNQRTVKNTTQIITAMALLAGLSLGGELLAQGFGGPGANSFGSAPLPNNPGGGQSNKPKVTRGLSRFATDEEVLDIRVIGNKTVPAARIMSQMQTRIGRPYDPRVVANDVRKLNALPYFVSVRPLSEVTDEGRIIILEVVERTAIRYIEILGNERIKDKKIAQEINLRVGGAVDPYAVGEARRTILDLYKENGFGRAVVHVEEGNKPDDRGVTFVITEGPQQRVWNVEFEGNTFATDGQLRTKIKTKNHFHRLWGGKIREQELQADINRLTDYYRSFGFFRARVGRVIDHNESGWATIKFVIDEGERYSIRNVSFFGVEKFDTSTLSQNLEQLDGQPFERAKLNNDLQWIKDVYGSKGYVFADVNAETIFLEEPGKIDLVYSVEEGDRFRIGQIHVNINGEESHTRVQTALNRIGIKPGDIANSSNIKDAERRLNGSSLFNSNPTTGTVPQITYRPSEQNNSRVAEKPSSSAQPTTVRKPPLDAYGNPLPSVYQVREPTQPSTPQRHTAYQQVKPQPVTTQTGYPQTGYQQTTAPQNTYGGQAVAPTSPTAVQAGYQEVGTVQRMSASAPNQPVTQAYPTSTYNNQAAGQVQPVQYTQQPTPATETLPPPNNYGAAQPNYGNTTPSYGSAQPNYGSIYSGNPVVETIPAAPTNTGIFPSPVFAPTPVPAPNDPMVDLFVNLEETQTGRFMVGVAVNSDAGLVGQILLDERNFDWRNPPRSFSELGRGAWRGGGQRFRLEAAPGSEVQRYTASWTEPYLLDTPISLSLSGSYYDRRFDDWDEQRLGGRIGLGYQWTENDLSAQLTYRGESVKIHEITAANLGAIPDYAEMNGDNQLHGFGVRVINDTRNNPFLATEGYYLSGTLEQVVGSFDYTRAEFEGRTYYLLNERPDHTGRHVLIYQTRLGFTGSNTPVYDRFFAGGFSTMRGFDFRGASPVAGPNNAEVGGDFRWLNSLEYLFPLSADGMINGLLFCDFGTVEESVKIDDFRIAPGFGLRLTVPAMGPAPIALDFAFPVASADTDEEQIFTFNVGFTR